MKRLFTLESVTEGHQIRFVMNIRCYLDALLTRSNESCACETAITTGLVLVMGEITTKAYVDIQKLLGILFVNWLYKI